MQFLTGTIQADGDPVGVQPRHPGDLRHGVCVPVAPKEAEAVLIAERVQKAADRRGQLPGRVIVLHADRGRDALGQLVEHQLIAAASFLRGVGVIALDGQVPGDAADVGTQRPRILRRDAVPYAEPGIIGAFLLVLPIVQDIGRRFPYGRAVFSVQFHNGLFRALIEQGNDLAVLQCRHFLSASPYIYPFRQKYLIGIGKKFREGCALPDFYC